MMMGRYHSYLDYQNSGIEWLGDIPAGWKVFRGKFVFSEFGERSETGDEELLSVSEYYGVKPRGEVIDEGDFLSRAESLVGYKKCYKNDLVMNIMLAWKRGLGVTKYDGIVSPAYSVFRFHENASPDYMHYLLRTDLFTGHFKTRSTGVIDSRLRLYPESFANVPILVPQIPEQIQIANFLDHETAKIDTLIDKQQQLIKLLKEKRQAVISHAVTKGLNPDAPMKDSGVEWLGEVPEHWEVAFLKYFWAVLDCKHITAEVVEDGIPLASIKEVKSWVVDLNEAKKTTETFYELLIDGNRKPTFGDIIYSRNATVGEAALVPENVKFAMGQDVCLLKKQTGFNSEYFLHQLNSPVVKLQLESLLIGSTFKRINVEEIRNYLVVIPPVEEQDEIADYLQTRVNRYDLLIGKAETAITLMHERRTALISAAVTGKIDVRNWQPAQTEISMEASA
jgi:type I restriction enzyme S subunit